ncbi:unnamed protein product [Didymodactylos carnosus]|uniref:Uncharacterized protein n=1 Tax=Didymodactylos carnosus TaxID=1234261 RepID=A0A814KQT2_9BILA|nr:unnamed protein product [Didymodactylos carnosus]CAF3823324.1 unnamed protein product [Didymodactylos carnosus]
MYNRRFAFELKENEFITDEEIYTSLTSDNLSQNGLNEMLQESTFDVLLLINSCHSGGFCPALMNEHKIDMNNQFDEYLRLNLNISPEARTNIENLRDCTDELPEDFCNYIQNWFQIFGDISHSAMVISSCKENEESSFLGSVSPFFRYIIDVFNTATNVTPNTLYENLQRRIHDMLPNLQTNLHNLDQHVQQPFRLGHYAGKTSLKPVVKPYQ